MGRRKRVVSTVWVILDGQLEHMPPAIRSEYMAMREAHGRMVLDAVASKAGRIVPRDAVVITMTRPPEGVVTQWCARAQTAPRPDWKKPRKRP